MTVGLMSLFRNRAGKMDTYFTQVKALHRLLAARGDDLVLFCVEGDSADRTPYELQRQIEGCAFAGHLLTASHGGPMYGSTEKPERLDQLTFVINSGLDQIVQTSHVDALIYVEPDLFWDASTWLYLLSRLEPGVDIVAPLIFIQKRDTFYDVWGFRELNGDRFGPGWKPRKTGDALFEVSTVGSGFIMRGPVATFARCINGMAVVGLCEDARAKGYHVWVAPTERITHPQ